MIETHTWSVIVWPSSFFFLHFLKGQQHNHVAIVSKSSVYTIAAIFISSKSCNNHFINAFSHHSVSHPSLSLLAITKTSQCLPSRVPPPETPCCIAFPTPTTGRSLPTYHPGEKQGEGGRAPLQSVFLAELFLLSPEPHNVRPSDLFMFEYLLLLSQTSVLYFLFRLGDSR